MEIGKFLPKFVVARFSPPVVIFGTGVRDYLEGVWWGRMVAGGSGIFHVGDGLGHGTEVGGAINIAHW